MGRENALDWIWTCGLVYDEPTKKEVYASKDLLTMEEAAECASKALTGGITFKITKIQLYYAYGEMQGYPCAVLFHSLTLTMLSIIMQGEMLIVFDLLGHKIIGLIALIALNGLGCSLIAITHEAMWLLPMAHTIFGLHFFAASPKPIMPIAHSYLYFALWLIVLSVIGLILAKRTAFHGKLSFLTQH